MLQPITKPLSRQLFEVAYPFDAYALGWYIAIRAGFHTDGASIPRCLWSIIGNPWQGAYLGPAIIHDALYQSEATDRATADELLYSLLRANSVGRCRAWIIYRAVRAFGWAAWNNRNDADVATAKQYVEVHHV